MQKAVIVVPCYNEERRLDGPGFRDFLDAPDVSLLFVDDGSTDRTAQVLEELGATLAGRAAVLRLGQNGGKAEAVRRGMLRALAEGAAVTGYLDADLATPPGEMVRLLELLRSGSHDVALAARVRLLGTDIVRKPLRHYLGRVFATCASLCLGIPVYDTQCGAKLFRRTEALEAALAEPFTSRWAFDVELIGRLLTGTTRVPGLPLERIVEMPVRRWHDVGGSKVHLKDFPRMGLDLLRIHRALSRRRSAAIPRRPTRGQESVNGRARRTEPGP
jgi:glycosyltransferase involved in cell wall biosynthesis